jgi:hypothetical protein
MSGKTKRFTGKHALLLICICWIAVFAIWKPWKENLIVNDVVSYYGYLPAAIIHHDLSLKFNEKDPAFFSGKYWPETSPNGGKVIKTTLGLSLLYAPFFIIAHILAPLFGQAQDGFSAIYQVSVLAGTLFFLFLGFYYMRKLLLFYFSDQVSGIIMLSLFFGTNLFWYSTFDGLMPHVYVFSLVTFFVYQTASWHRHPEIRTAFQIGISGGLLLLIRPITILCFLIFILFGLKDKNSFQNKIRLFSRNIPHLGIIVMLVLGVFSLQLFYWKYTTGSWLFFSYVGERFYFDHPHIIEGLFGFRKGWFVYTPLMIFSLWGFLYTKKKAPEFFMPLLVFIPLSIYILLSWWAWWYGGGFGLRAFVDFYGLFAIPIAAIYDKVFEKGKIYRWLLISFISVFCLLNLFQTWQYRNNLIHFDSMTAKSYKLGFLSRHGIEGWNEALEEPDYKRAKAGLSEYPDPEEIEKLWPSDKLYLVSYNGKALSAELADQTQLTASRYERKEWEAFSIIWLEKDKIALKAANNKYVSADHASGNKLFANRDNIGAWEMFTVVFLGRGRIALKADNGKYVGISPYDQISIIAKLDSVTKTEQFRILFQ